MTDTMITALVDTLETHYLQENMADLGDCFYIG